MLWPLPLRALQTSASNCWKLHWLNRPRQGAAPAQIKNNRDRFAVDQLKGQLRAGRAGRRSASGSTRQVRVHSRSRNWRLIRPWDCKIAVRKWHTRRSVGGCGAGAIGAELAVLGEPLSPYASLRCYAPAAFTVCQPGFMAAKLMPAARRKSLEPEVNKNAPEIFVVFFHAAVQRANVPLIQEAQHSLF